MMRPTGFALRTFLTLALGSLFAGATYASIWTVCSSGCDFTSIQAAVDAAASGDTIELGAETYFESVVVTQSLSIRGAGEGDTIVDGTGAPPGTAAVFKAVFVEGPDNDLFLRLEDMTIQNGPVGVMFQFESFSGLAEPEVTITRTLVSGNQGPGIIADSGLVIITSSSIANNGGAGFEGRHLDAEQSTISGNGGAGIDAGGHVSIVQSNISENNGVGVRLRGGARITNSTISGNNGGGIEDSSAACLLGEGAVITTTTIAGNWATGIKKTYRDLYCPGSSPPEQIPVQLKRSVVANNVGQDCSKDSQTTIISHGYSLAGDSTCGLVQATDLPNTDPLLVPLADNGGPTATHALAPGSPAIDAGGSDCEPTDQRDVPRPQDGNGDGVALCDIGAFELDSLPVEIDIKPGGFPNSINPRSRGVIPVALLGSEGFDVADVDVSTLRFGPDQAQPGHNGHFEDANFDGIMDLVAHFPTQETGVSCGMASAALTGSTTEGQPFSGNDSIETVGCLKNEPRPAWNPQRVRRDAEVSTFGILRRS